MNRIIQYTSRLICIVSVAWFGLIVIGSVDSAKQISLANDKNDDRLANLCLLPQALMPTEGYWSFPETGLSVAQFVCETSELQEHLNLSSMTNAKANADFDASELVELAASSGATRVDSESGTLWSHENRDIKVRLLTSEASPPMLIGAVVAMRDGDQWQLVSLSPKQNQTTHLLAMPTDATTTCTRRSPAGDLQMELITTSEPNERLIRRWVDDGWEVQHTPWGDAESFSYLCARGEEVIYAWAVASSTERTIMLTSATSNSRINGQPETNQ